MLVRELLVLSQLTTISIYIENSFLRTPKPQMMPFRKKFVSLTSHLCNCEGLPGVLGNKATSAKYRREQGNISQFLGTGDQNFEKVQYENILRECGNMGT